METIFRRIIRLIEEHIKLCFTFDELRPDNIEEFERKYEEQNRRCEREKEKLQAELKYYFRNHR